MPRRSLSATAVLMLCSSALAAPVTINFDDTPASGGPIAKDRYAGQGVLMSLDGGAIGPFGDGFLISAEPPAGLPPPAAGLGIVPYASLAAFMGDFVFDFTTPITYFSLHAFDGAQAVRAKGYRGGLLIGEFAAPAEPGRLALEMTLGSIGGSTTYDRVVIDLSHGFGPGDPAEGPRYYDVLTFNPVPAPGAASLIAGGMFAVGRRRR